MTVKLDARTRRKFRVRNALKRAAPERPRLSIHRSGKHIYAQVIDDRAHRTLAAASTLDKDVRAEGKASANCEAATQVGKLVGERALAAGVKQVKFDRGAFLFHGRVKALADAAREAGLEF